MHNEAQNTEALGREDLARLVVDFLHRTLVHHTLWFAEVERQMGMPKALEVMGAAWEKSYAVQMKRLSEAFGFELEKGLPKTLLDMPQEKLLALLGDLGRNWLAGDGIWFQAVEARDGLWDAKRCNDSCWVRFSPFEAWSIRRFLNLPEMPGLAGLKQALGFRLYAGINTQSIVEEGPESLVFRMNNCRVQSARKQRGLEDYPCKSAGLVEYRAFAETIDPRIRTECIACPPDAHPDEWFCAWRFTLTE
ncbi:MAG: DUF6125 family protein [Deltaproteobacteria bacterium]|nr:DUF6125 family protein [Deltaproteobacteria bacterium]